MPYAGSWRARLRPTPSSQVYSLVVEGLRPFRLLILCNGMADSDHGRLCGVLFQTRSWKYDPLLPPVPPDPVWRKTGFFFCSSSERYTGQQMLFSGSGRRPLPVDRADPPRSAFKTAFSFHTASSGSLPTSPKTSSGTCWPDTTQGIMSAGDDAQDTEDTAGATPQPPSDAMHGPEKPAGNQ